MNANLIKEFSLKVRKNILFGAFNAGASSAHIGGALSVVEMISTIYCFSNIVKSNVTSPDRDRVILSKGHACLALYGCLVEKGIIKKQDLKLFEKNGGFLLGHPVFNLKKGIEFSTGSLGMGLSLAIGAAIAAKLKKKKYKTYVIQGDGECNEGSVWEGAMLASQKKLNNLVMLIDKNNYQQTGSSKDILNLENLSEKWKSFGWEVVEIDGHNIDQILKSLKIESSKPLAIIGNTIKGKGLKKAENNNNWHHTILTKKDYEQSLMELE